MKNVIVLLAIISLSVGCKKKDVKPTTTEVYCVFKTENGVKSFYKCASTSDEAANECIKLRDAGYVGSTSKKSSCIECN